MIKINKILITGGAGFIGYYISKILSENTKNKIHIVDNLSKGKRDDEFINLLEKENVTFYEIDLSKRGSFSELLREYNQIYHLAAIVGVKTVSKNPVLTLRNNTLSTIYLLDYISKMKNNPKILFASSCENYAGSIKQFNSPIPTPEDIPLCIEDVYNPRWTYAISKILGEIACIFYSKENNFKTTIIRYHNVYGPRMGFEHVIPEFILRLHKNPSKLEMYGGNQFRTFCFVQDAAEMTIKLINNEEANNKIINIGSEDEIQITSLAKKIFKIMNVFPEIIERGAPLGSVERRKPDLKLIKQLGSYIFKTTLDDGLKKTFEWYYEKIKSK